MDWQTAGPFKWKQELTGSTFHAVYQTIEQWNLAIDGPAGRVIADDMGYYGASPREEIIKQAYWDIVHTLNGHYHCCLSGKCRYAI
jgi:hypothetical protein